LALPLLRFDMGRMFAASSVRRGERPPRHRGGRIDCARNSLVDEIDKAFVGSQSSGVTDAAPPPRLRHVSDLALGKECAGVRRRHPNDVSQLPPELLRKGRLDEIFYVDLPSEEEQQKSSGSIWPSGNGILMIHLRPWSRPARL